MNTRSRSITRELILRMLLAGLVLGVIAGIGTYLLERRRIEVAIEERATLGVELLRASVRQLAWPRGVCRFSSNACSRWIRPHWRGQ